MEKFTCGSYGSLCGEGKNKRKIVGGKIMEREPNASLGFI